MRRYNKYQNNDPREMDARFDSVCRGCGKIIHKGDKIIYWPLGKSAYHYDCSEEDFRASMSSIQDEDMFVNAVL